jgi:hypothetical protein
MPIDTGQIVTGAQSSIVTIQQLWDEILYGLLIVVFVWLIYKYASCRIIVETHEKVRGGYIIRKGRYGKYKDKSTGLQYLGSMWGGKKLPYFSPKFYYKLYGMPLVGINRQLSIIKINDYSYKVIQPPKDVDAFAEGDYVETMPWVFMNEKTIFLKKFKQSEFWHKLTIYAPLAIIIGAIFFWIYMIYLQNQVIKTETEQLVQTMELLRITITQVPPV